MRRLRFILIAKNSVVGAQALQRQRSPIGAHFEAEGVCTNSSCTSTGVAADASTAWAWAWCSGSATNMRGPTHA